MQTLPIRLFSRLGEYLRGNPNIIEAVIALLIKLVGSGLSFGFSFLVARELGAIGNGNFALAQLTAFVAMTFSLMGLDYVLLRTMAGEFSGSLIGNQQANRLLGASNDFLVHDYLLYAFEPWQFEHCIEQNRFHDRAQPARAGPAFNGALCDRR